MKKKQYLYIEFFVLFISVPILAFFIRDQIKQFIIPIIMLAGIAVFIILLRDNTFNKQKLKSLKKIREELPNILVRFLMGGSAITLITYLVMPDIFMSFPLYHFNTWILVMLLYPLLSVFTQEVLFRAFFFHRYRFIFSKIETMILMNGFTFGVAHLVFGNWIAPVLSVFGGLIFARTFSKSESIPVVCIEHALWGDLLFTIGLGYFFYSGII